LRGAGFADERVATTAGRDSCTTSSRGAKRERLACGSRVAFELPRERSDEPLEVDGFSDTTECLTLEAISWIWSFPSRMGQFRPDLPITSMSLRSEPWSQF
jgi:hypothetical protein